MPATRPTIRPAQPKDLSALVALEQACFIQDRLSRRRLKHWIEASNGVLLVAQEKTTLLGYGLVILHRGTRLARLYSLAISQQSRGSGLGRRLLTALEDAAADRGRIDMRLEVAENNHAAIALYRDCGYRAFGSLADYYEDHQNALRMQKRIRQLAGTLVKQTVPWYQQTTAFTCGPAALMMAMHSFKSTMPASRSLELQIWREATSIYMTAGHGGCHPIGLALAAQRRNFVTTVYISQRHPPFLDGVRSEEKKSVIGLVHEDFVSQAEQAGINVHYQAPSSANIAQALHSGALVLALISTYRMDRKKAPHWVTLTAVDDSCFYLHDPDPSDGEQDDLDCRHMPISRQAFETMNRFGRERLSTAVVIHPPE